MPCRAMHRKAPSRAQQVGTTVPVAALSAACCADSFTRSEINDIYHDRKGGGGEKRERVKMSISYSTAGNFDSSLVFSLSHTGIPFHPCTSQLYRVRRSTKIIPVIGRLQIERGWAKKVSLLIFAITLSTASQFP